MHSRCTWKAVKFALKMLHLVITPIAWSSRISRSLSLLVLKPRSLVRQGVASPRFSAYCTDSTTLRLVTSISTDKTSTRLSSIVSVKSSGSYHRIRLCSIQMFCITSDMVVWLQVMKKYSKQRRRRRYMKLSISCQKVMRRLLVNGDWWSVVVKSKGWLSHEYCWRTHQSCSWWSGEEFEVNFKNAYAQAITRHRHSIAGQNQSLCGMLIVSSLKNLEQVYSLLTGIILNHHIKIHLS